MNRAEILSYVIAYCFLDILFLAIILTVSAIHDEIKYRRELRKGRR